MLRLIVQRVSVDSRPDAEIVEETAMKVGARHGRPIVLKIECGQMANAGFTFYVSENGVWLTAHVPSAFVVFPDA